MGARHDRWSVRAVRRRPVVAGDWQSGRHLRSPRAVDAVHDLVGAQGRLPHAKPGRPEPSRAARAVAVFDGWLQVGVEGRDHSQGCAPRGVLDCAGDLGDRCFYCLRGHPLRPHSLGLRCRDTAAVDRFPRFRSLRAGDRVDRCLRAGSCRMVLGVHVPTPRRLAINGTGHLV